ncbi:class II glutamine amidotransferase, partial [Acinetobacter baumannii]
LLAHCSTQLAWIVREAPFAVAHLSDDDVSVDFRQQTGPDDRVVVIATAPLTDNEAWNIIAPQTLLLFHDGRLAASLPTAFEAPSVRQGAPVAHIAAEHAIPPALIA